MKICKKCLSAAVLICMCATAWAGGKKMRILMLQVEVMSAPKVWGSKSVGTLKHKDNVSMLEKKGSWAQIETDDKKIKGWVKLNSLEKYSWISRLGKSDDNVRETTSAAEASKAARGFDKQTEAKFRSDNPKADYSWIAKLETAAEFLISMEEMKKFVSAGKLDPKEESK